MKYANLIGYSDVQPYEVLDISESGKTIYIRSMICERGFVPEVIPGGFMGHCVNQNEQKWTIKQDHDAPIMKARLHKDGYFWSVLGKHKMEDAPRKFYDYNF